MLELIGDFLDVKRKHAIKSIKFKFSKKMHLIAKYWLLNGHQFQTFILHRMWPENVWKLMNTSNLQSHYALQRTINTFFEN